MTKLISINKWSEYQYPLPNQLMTQHQLLRALVKFRREVLKYAPLPTATVILQLKVKSSTGEYRSISRCYLIRINELTTILGELLLSLEIRSEAYNQMNIIDFIFSYKLIESEEKIINKSSARAPHSRTRKRLSIIQIGGYNLPRTMNLEEWGEVHWMPNEKEGIVYKYKSTGTYYFKIEGHTLHVELRYRNRVVVRFRDELLNTGNLTEFKRTVRNHTYYFRDGELLFNSLTFTKPYIKPTVKSPFLNSKIITMDLETRNIDGKIYPYAVSIFDGEEVNFFYLSDYADSDELLRESVKSLMQRRYHGYAVYLHNFSQFDGIFLVKILTELSSRTKIIMRESNIINVTFYFGRYHIYFRDSYLMLPVSLRVLAQQFNAPNKWIFPYRFVNIVDLDYAGAVPEYKYFDGISQYQYDQYASGYTSKSWNLRRETEFYCNQDVLALHGVITQFSQEIFDLFRVEVQKYPTLSSLAFAIYRSNFMPKDQICLLDGRIFEYIQDSYRGGYVDVFKPHGKDIRCYDVNSLYPFIMRKCKMPVGQPTVFHGDITKVYPDIIRDSDKFLFLKVEVESPVYIEKPFLLHRVGNGTGSRSIAPVGKWTGVYTGPEVTKAVELGYTVRIIDGLIFRAEYIFTEYVDVLYGIKKSNPKG